MKIRDLAVLLLPLTLTVGCVKPPVSKDYVKFRSEDPRSILIVPVVNRTVDVSAPDYLLSTLTSPVAERGYYVFPAYMVKRVMEDDGLSDADMVHTADPRKLAALFGADAVLYVSIEKWNAKYVLVSTSVEVEFNYVLKSGKSGEELWKDHQAWVYTPQNRSTGNALVDLFAMAINAAVTKAAPNYMPLARQANTAAFYPVHRGLPAGPHLEMHGKDISEF
jgi:hypothetical protein